MITVSYTHLDVYQRQAQHAHGASVSILPAVVHRPGGSRGVDEPVGLITVATVVTDGQDCGIVLG